MAHLTHRSLANNARKAILSASKEADRLDETTIGTEHLLLGVLRERKSVGGKILKELGVTYDATRDAILDAAERLLERGSQPTIVAVAHEAGVALVVDQAWGPHFGFHEALPPTALSTCASSVVGT